ncbi:MAG: hypothetical protein KAG66_10290, partial [Methylococcales bacterium]|nr:hypothetical protein [Methylococcales bacterium]
NGFYDDDPDKHTFLGRSVKPGLRLNENLTLPIDDKSLICIGNNSCRARLTRHLHPNSGLAIHPSAMISTSATVGAGTLVSTAERFKRAHRWAEG